DTDQALDFLQQFFKDRKEIGKAPKEELKGYLTALKGAVKERIKQKNEASGSVKRITSKVFPHLAKIDSFSRRLGKLDIRVQKATQKPLEQVASRSEKIQTRSITASHLTAPTKT